MDERKNCEFVAKCDKLDKFECKDALERLPLHPGARRLVNLGAKTPFLGSYGSNTHFVQIKP